jgi:hypothetical protein
LDGKLDTRWTTAAVANGSEFFQVDLGANRTFKGVQLLTTGPVNAFAEYAKRYEVYVNNPAGGWIKVAAGTGYGPVMNIAFSPRTAKYVHIKNVSSSGNGWSIGEVNVLT